MVNQVGVRVGGELLLEEGVVEGVAAVISAVEGGAVADVNAVLCVNVNSSSEHTANI